ncbi:MAG: hypothetical protein KGY81_05020 [Phycisphaerae bacterium]|nr:hypothetical protein [Phycisphaerae bacterium]
MVISVHTPRTAGHTIGYILKHSCRQRIWLYYPPLADGVRFAPDPADRDVIARHADFVRGTFDYVHGHFTHAFLADLFPDAAYVASLRHPVDRILSHHAAYVAATGDVRTPLLEFAARGDVANMQSAFLAGRDVEAYDHLFLIERLAESMQVFAAKNSGFRRLDEFCMSGIPRFSALPEDRAVKADDDTRRHLQKLAADDMALYRRAEQRCRAEESQYL